MISDLEYLPGLVNKEVSPNPRVVILVLEGSMVATMVLKEDVSEAMVV